MAVERNNLERTTLQRRDALVGEVLDRRFRIEAKIAAGGFGAIYRATHLKSGHQFALKVLHPSLTGAPDVVARFRREGAALTRLRDPHTVTAYQFGEAHDGTLYIVMELLRGESLYERYRAHGPLPWQRMVAIARAVCGSLAEAHAFGIIHRDLKPTNIHLEPRGNEQDFVKVLDFGIAKILQDSDMDSSDLTQAGQMIGTLDYMSPEQMVGGLCTASSDVYTLGVVMYEMIAGGKPFDDANSAAAALASVLTTNPPRLSERAIVTPDVDRIVMRCLERQHTDRFQTAVELAKALDEILPGVEEVVTLVAAGSRTTMPAVANVAAMDPDAISADLEAAPGDLDTVRVDPSAVLDPAAASLDQNGVTDPEARPVNTENGLMDSNSIPIPGKLALGVPDAAQVIPVSDQATLKLTPAPRSERTGLGSTLVGYPQAERVAPAGRLRQIGTPPVGTPIVPIKNLRESYPTIHHPPPSPMRPPQSRDRPITNVAPFDMAQTVRRDAVFRRLALVVSVAVAILVVLLIASRL
ncbi:MAG TPA: serine/threonine-protein kinase [Kofleriaceae bacterium]|nr:serine/threonine-protein kinase [Kofleriaceae bacterium]